MRLLIIDPSGSGLDLSYRAQCAGHKVKHFIRQSPKTDHIGRGLVDVIEEYQPWLNWADLIFCTDNTKYLRDLDVRRAFGQAIIGPSQEMAEWELDRGRGMEVLRAHGIDTPPTKEFSSYDKAIDFVTKDGGRFVSKPSGSDDKSLSYCANDAADMIFMLERWKKNAKGKAPFILQEFIPGIEMAVGGWFGPSGFNRGWLENFEFKKLMDGDLGVATGEQGTVIRYVDDSKLARIVLEPLEETLAKGAYCGFIDINCIIDEQGTPWPLEFTMRPGWPTFNIQQSLHFGDPVEWLLDLAEGKDARNISIGTVAIGVVLSIPDYPYSHLTRKEVIGIPVYGITPRMMEHVHMCEMMMGKDLPVERNGTVVREDMPVTAGDYVLVVSGTAETVWDAKRSAYGRLNRLSLPNSPMWRTDIGDRLSKQLPKLQALGYATGMEFSTNQAP